MDGGERGRGMEKKMKSGKNGNFGAVRLQRPSFLPVQIRTSPSETQREFWEREVRSEGRRTKRDEAIRSPV